MFADPACFSFESKVGGVTIVRDLIRNEGFMAFFKGLTPKVGDPASAFTLG
jgi:hypothetical protein